ncbi:MAG TPA: GGIII-like transmembrane region-containing protein [Candidatus Paceibacterota bacterium]|nr:GGIII-like transmembrane region-containing protein [Candidatus Paceibacterota bacterium]
MYLIAGIALLVGIVIFVALRSRRKPPSAGLGLNR